MLFLIVRILHVKNFMQFHVIEAKICLFKKCGKRETKASAVKRFTLKIKTTLIYLKLHIRCCEILRFNSMFRAVIKFASEAVLKSSFRTSKTCKSMKTGNAITMLSYEFRKK